MKNSNPFLGVPSVSSNTLIKPNTEKRKTEKEGWAVSEEGSEERGCGKRGTVLGRLFSF
jgi:hypothetical protein